MVFSYAHDLKTLLLHYCLLSCRVKVHCVKSLKTEKDLTKTVDYLAYSPKTSKECVISCQSHIEAFWINL